MQKLFLERKKQITGSKPEATLGILYMEGKELCRTLENPWLDNKPYISCVPTGKYLCKKYSSEKYPDVWELQNVKDRTYILIHAGNIAKHTQGCILVGFSWGFIDNDVAVLSSRNALYKLRNELDDEFELNII